MALRPKLPQVQDAIGLLIDDRLKAIKVPSSVGFPAGGLKKEHAWVSGSDSGAEFSAYVSGGRQREETGEVEIRIKVDKTTTTYTDARNRAYEIEAQIEDAVESDPTLGGLVAWARVTRVRGDEAIPDNKTRSAGLRVTVTYDATNRSTAS